MADGFITNAASDRSEDRLAHRIVGNHPPAILESSDEIDPRLRRADGAMFVVLPLQEHETPFIEARRRVAIPVSPSGELITPSLIATFALVEWHSGGANTCPRSEEVLFELPDREWHKHRRKVDDLPTALDTGRLVAALERHGLVPIGPAKGPVPQRWPDLFESLTERRAAEVPSDLRHALEELPPREHFHGGGPMVRLTERATYREGNVEVRRDSGGPIVITFNEGEITPEMVATNPQLGHRIADILAWQLARLYARRVGPVELFHPRTGLRGRSDVLGFL